MSRVVVFRGPTLSASTCAELLDAVFLPPAAQGDVYRAARSAPRAIGIIDGTFERTPAVWHKEVLWALSQGIHVFGAASMGALRASELCAFGMEGVGRIFEWFRDGVLEDDDEVAVAHADASFDYRSLSEAMVNIRATVEAAEHAGVISTATAATLLRCGKALYYPERSYPALLVAARDAGLAPDVIEAFTGFLPQGRVNQKQLDALAMLRRMRELEPTQAVPKVVNWSFEHTDAWDQVVARLSKSGSGVEQSGVEEAALLDEELRLDPPLSELTRRGALLRTLADEEARRSGYQITPALRDLTQDAFRRERGLEESEAIWQWLARNRLKEADFGRFLEAEARLRWLRAMYASADAEHLTAELRASGAYEALRSRAISKHELLVRRGFRDPELSDAGLLLPALVEWYFETRLQSPVPHDLQAYLHQAGLSNIQEFTREALREYLFLKLSNLEEPWQPSDSEA